MDRGDGMQRRLEIPPRWLPKRALPSRSRSIYGLATMRYIGASRVLNFASLSLWLWFVAQY